MTTVTKRDDYYWVDYPEPHAERKKKILEKHPEIAELYGYDPNTKFIMLFWVVLQFSLAIALRNSSWLYVVGIAWAFGAIAGQALVLGLHEVSHNLLFESDVHNKIFGLFANTSIIFPHFSMFQRYHLDHHQKQGSVQFDTDIPSRWEAGVFVTTSLKILWLLFQPWFYITRPLLVSPKSPAFWDIMNWCTCAVSGTCLYYLLGSKAIWYLFLSAYFGAGLHPVTAHFISEHYVFTPGQETYSYYGPLNALAFNVGYHNEHHDFPRIPGSRLPKVREIAPEFYNNLTYYTSWPLVYWKFITDPNMTPFSRIVRK